MSGNYEADRESEAYQRRFDDKPDHPAQKEIAMENFEKTYDRGSIVVNGSIIRGVVVEERRCTLQTSYEGDLLDLVMTFDLGDGTTATRTYWCRGAGIERSGVRWSIDATQDLVDRVRKRCEEELHESGAKRIFDVALLLGVDID